MPPDLIVRLVVRGVVVGVLASALLAWLWVRHARAARDGAEPTPGPSWALPVLMSLGFALTDHAAKQQLAWWPADNTIRTMHAALLLGLVGVIEGLRAMHRVVVPIVRAIAFGAVAWLLCVGYAPHTISNADLVGWVLLAAIGGSAVATLADRAMDGTRGWTASITLLVMLATIMPALKLAGLATGSMALVGPIAALSGATLVALVGGRTVRVSRGAVTVAAGMVLIGLIGASVQTAPRSAPALALLGLTPLALIVPALDVRPVRTLIVRTIVAGALAGSAIGVLVAHNAHEAARDPYSSYR